MDSRFILFYLDLVFFRHSSMNINSKVYPAAAASTYGYAKSTLSCLVKRQVRKDTRFFI